MIIDELTLEDFGAYGGRQTIDLSPPSKARPIILIGGLNGGGKTTLMDAIQLCLYGKFAPCSNRGSLSYSDFLQQCIHQQDEKHDASLELAFRHTVDGVEERYRLIRSWSLKGDSVSERFRVFLNEQEDEFLSQNWVESVERILPRRIANLFLFDGEKIERYASPADASELIRTATHNLLGMDIVDQLGRDLDTLKKRKQSEKANAKVLRDIEAAQEEFDRLSRERRQLHQELASLRTHDLGRVQKELEGIELEFQQKGGDLYERQTELEAELSELNQAIVGLENELRLLAAGNLPLLLVSGLVEQVIEAAKHEQIAERNQQFVKEVQVRDAEVLRLLEADGAPQAVRDALKAFFDKDTDKRAAAAHESRVLELSASALAQAEYEAVSGFKASSQRCQELLSDLEDLRTRHRKKRAELDSVPAAEVIKDLIIGREDALERLDNLRSQIRDGEEELRRLDGHVLRSKQRLAKLIETRVKADFEQEDALRIVSHASKVQETLEEFRKQAVARHIGRIEKFIADSFKSLVRKSSLVTALRINPETFEIKLYGHKKAVISPERLSAGERQLFAVATLWGLARASNRQLPTVIDTPLGRLDSKHRNNLVERYFPEASHQVILLSTDEEIANGHVAKLEGKIGRSYELVFDQLSNSTSVRPGYFASETSHVH